MHNIQQKILKTISNKEKLSFSELNTQDISNDWFSYHVKQLCKNGLLVKMNSSYSLTELGKKQLLLISNRYHRISVLAVIEHNGKYVIQKRNIHPYKDFWEFPTRKISFGEKPQDTLKNLLHEECNLEAGVIAFLGVNHKIEEKDDAVFDDKYYMVFKIDNVQGDLRNTFSDAENYWLSMKEYLQKQKRHYDDEKTLSLIKKPGDLKNIVCQLENY